MKLPPHHTFADPALGERALTHPSFSAQHNERLEWLGDAILEFEVSRLLYLRFPEMTEGDLSQIRAKLVTNATLAQVSRRLNLGDYARIGGADMQGGRENDNLLADLTEAYLAAIYLDGGDAQAHIGYWFGEEVEALVAQVKKHGIRSLRSPKTQLQEHLPQAAPSRTQVPTPAAGRQGQQPHLRHRVQRGWQHPRGRSRQHPR